MQWRSLTFGHANANFACKFFCVYRLYKESISKQMNNDHYHSLYTILDFDWLIHLQITACKYFIEHAHLENASSASIKNI